MTASGILQGHPHYLHWGVIQISAANLVVILSMIVLFVLALVLPFPHGHDADTTSPTAPVGDAQQPVEGSAA